ncbi:C4-dicarboxylate ABC transporter substrate-binding protein [Chromatiales bacterium (ex Bugula neritina AB1)]|nr:C4-dicarboxylate ABC transporter substrate-binding protein [Chromatiales bacterium (ex Bugula neritina AB1)]
MKPLKIKTAIIATATLFIANTADISWHTAQAAEVEGPKLQWNFSAWGKRRAFTEGVEAMAAHINAKTDGNFDIKIHYGGALSKPRENLDGISLGAFEMGMFCASYHPDKNRAVTVLELPMLPVANASVQKAIDLAVYNHPYTQKEMARWNARILMSAALPQYEFMGRGEPPLTLADFSGMRVRALGGIGEAMKVLGAVPTTVTAPETYQAIESGTVDAAAFAFYSHFSYRINEVSTWRTTNLSPGSVNCPTMVNIDAYDSLPDQYKALMDEAKDVAYAALNEAYSASIDKFTPVADDAGIEKITYSAEELAEFRDKAAAPVWKAWVEKQSAAGVPAQELLDLVLKTASEASQ